MKASDVMTTAVISASPQDSVLSVVEKMLEHRISAVPIVDDQNHVGGVVSEGDLMNRRETQTARSRSWWLDLFVGSEERAAGFLKTRGTRASDVMTAPAITATEDETAADVARKLERHHIKRVPIVRDGRLVGIISRANLLRSFASGAAERVEPTEATQVREAILTSLDEAGVMTHLIGVQVTDDAVELWGLVESPEQIAVARAAVEDAAPSKTLQNQLSVRPHLNQFD